MTTTGAVTSLHRVEPESRPPPDDDAATLTLLTIHPTDHAPDAPGARRAETRIIVGARATVVLTPGDAVVIGRQGNHRVDDQHVSRQHLSVTLSYSGLMCRDLGSSNGSWLVRCGRHIRLGADAVALGPADRIVTAGDVELVSVPGATT